MPDVRLAAVHEMLRSIDEDSVAILRARLEKESDADVKQAMREGLALADLDSSEAETRLAAVKALEESLSPDVYNRLTAMVTARRGRQPIPNPMSACASRRAKSSQRSIRSRSCLLARSRRCSSA